MWWLAIACAPEPDTALPPPTPLPPTCVSPPRVGSTAAALRASLPDDAVKRERGRNCGVGVDPDGWDLPHEVELQGIPCTGTLTLIRDGRGGEARCRAARDVCLDGFPLAAGREIAWDVATGSILRGTLASPAAVGTVACGPGSFSPPRGGTDGFCRADDAPTRVEGLSCEGLVRMHADGRLENCELAEPAVLPSARLHPEDRRTRIACRKRTSFHADGTVETCTLAEPTRLRGLDLPAGSRLSWSEAGELTLHEGGGTGEAVEGCERTSVRTYPTGDRARCALSAPARVAGLDVPAGTSVWWDPWGRVSRVSVATAHQVDGVPCTGEIALWPDGGLRSCRVAVAHVEPGGRAFRAGEKIERPPP